MAIEGTQIDRFAVLSTLGTGAMGVVYEAHDPQLGRSIALKLIKARSEQPLEEARAMARIEHPNVVTVFDCGVDGDRVWIAMELCPQSVRAWLNTARDWRAVLDVFIAAGHGLAAAHAAGLIHRDFKPDNVLIDAHGRARVSDFGLALAIDGEASPEAPGTPAYMSPEQVCKGELTTASDQFSFCVSLYEALDGERPFVSRVGVPTTAGVTAAIVLGQVRGRPRRVPRWLGDIVMRGLEVDPERRFASMKELVAALERGLRRRRRVATLGGIIALVAATVTAVIFAASPSSIEEPDRCEELAVPITARWNPLRASTYSGAYASIDVPYGRSVWSAIEPRIRARAEDIAKMRVEACRSHATGAQSATALDLRMTCLDRQVQRFDAALEVLATPTKEDFDSTVRLVDDLEPVTMCADLLALSAPTRMPSDIPTRARIHALYKTLYQIDAATAAATTSSADAIQRLITEARIVAYPPLLAESLELGSEVHITLGQYVEAERDARAAILAADTAHDDRLRTSAILRLAHLSSEDGTRDEEVLALFDQAAAILDRTKVPVMQQRLLNNQAGFHRKRGRLNEALRFSTMAVEVADATRVPLAMAAAHGNLANILGNMRRPREALEHFAIAEINLQTAYGPQHPDHAKVQLGRANAAMLLAHYDDAIAFYRAALENFERVSPTHRGVVASLLGLQNVLNLTGNEREAIDVGVRGLALARLVFGPTSVEIAGFLSNLGDSHRYLGAYTAALERYREALVLLEKVDGPLTAKTNVRTGMGIALTEQGDYTTALVELQAAVAAMDADPEVDPDDGSARLALGVVLYHRGRASEAVLILTRALGELHDEEVSQQASANFFLARAMWDTNRRTHAIEHARTARALYAKAGTLHVADLTSVDAWLVGHVP